MKQKKAPLRGLFYMAREIFLVADPAGTNIPTPPLNPDALAYNIAIIRGWRCIGVMGMAMPALIAISWRGLIAISWRRIVMPLTIAVVI